MYLHIQLSCTCQFLITAYHRSRSYIMILNTLMPFFIKVHTSFSSFRLSSSIDLPRQIFVSLIYLHSLISSDYFCSHFSFFSHSFVSSFHPPFYHLPPTPPRSHIRSLPFSRCPPLSFCFSFSLSPPSQLARRLR